MSSARAGVESERSKPTQPLMRSQLVVAAIRMLRAMRGAAAVDELRSRFALGPTVEDDPDVTLPVDVHRRLMDAAARLAGDPLFGVHVARGAGRDLFGVLSFSARVSPTLREALRRIARFSRLSNDAVDIVLEEHRDGSGSFVHRLVGEPECLGRHDNEFFVALIVEEGRRLTGGAAIPERVWLAHGAPGDVRLDEELGVTEIAFGAGENGVRYSARALDAPFVTADAALLAYLDKQAEAALAELASSRGVVARAHLALRERLPGKAPTLEGTARELGMSGRSLQRRLADEGTSFQELLDDVREGLARALVSEGGRPLAEIAHRLGYAELRPFLRAFKRWTGLTPSAFRQRRPAR
jgi:AraC-like DNA-binding protein